MARSFDTTGGSYMELASAFGLSAGFGLTLVAFFKRAVVSQTGYVMALSNGAGSGSVQLVGVPVGALGLLYAERTVAGVSTTADTVTTNTTNWVHASCVFNGGVSEALADATTDGSTAGSLTPGVSQFNIGNLNSNNAANMFNGSVASIAGYSTDSLSLAEIQSLAKGFPPRRVRPQSLKFYIPLVRDAIEWQTGQSFATSGGTVVDHPRSYGF